MAIPSTSCTTDQDNPKHWPCPRPLLTFPNRTLYPYSSTLCCSDSGSEHPTYRRSASRRATKHGGAAGQDGRHTGRAMADAGENAGMEAVREDNFADCVASNEGERESVWLSGLRDVGLITWGGAWRLERVFCRI